MMSVFAPLIVVKIARWIGSLPLGLTETLHRDRYKRKRKQRITAILGTLLAVVSAFSLSGLTSMTQRLDAEAIAQISRQHIEDHLPGARLKMQDYLTQEAPRIARDTIRIAF